MVNTQRNRNKQKRNGENRVIKGTRHRGDKMKELKDIKEITIGCVPYDLSVETIIDGNDDNLGHINYTKQTIRIKDGLKGKASQVTLIHEVIHGILEEMGEKDKNEEPFVRVFSTLLLQVLDQIYEK